MERGRDVVLMPETAGKQGMCRLEILCRHFLACGGKGFSGGSHRGQEELFLRRSWICNLQELFSTCCPTLLARMSEHEVGGESLSRGSCHAKLLFSDSCSARSKLQLSPDHTCCNCVQAHVAPERKSAIHAPTPIHAPTIHSLRRSDSRTKTIRFKHQKMQIPAPKGALLSGFGFRALGPGCRD